MLDYLFPKILRKIKLNKAAYRILSTFQNGKIEINEEVVQKSLRVLNEKHPDKSKTCLINNKVSDNPQYDLVIIVPSYNVIQYIQDCIDSIVNQKTNYHFQVKIIDDGSTDGTWDLLQGYNTNPKVILLQKKNGGSGSAMNVGLMDIDAKYVMFVDADDQLMPNAIQDLLDIINKHDDVDIVEGQYEYFNSHCVINRSYGKELISDNWSILQGYQWLKVYRSFMFNGIGFPEGCWHQDTVGQFVRYQYARKIMIVPNLIYRYRQNRKGISFTAKHSYKALDSFWVTLRLLEDKKRLGQSFTITDYEIFLDQIAHNLYRIAWTDKDVIEAEFVLSVGLKNMYFSNFKAITQKCIEIEHFLDNGNLNQFLLFCKYIF